MDKLFNAYASQRGIDPHSMRFLFDGVRILGHHTPDFLKLEDHDQILCVLDQDGGVGSSRYVQYLHHGESIHILMMRSLALSKINHSCVSNENLEILSECDINEAADGMCTF